MQRCMFLTEILALANLHKISKGLEAQQMAKAVVHALVRYGFPPFIIDTEDARAIFVTHFWHI